LGFFCFKKYHLATLLPTDFPSVSLLQLQLSENEENAPGTFQTAIPLNTEKNWRLQQLVFNTVEN
jgi:hypothetical protein